MGAGFSRGKQDDPRCNGTLRKQASPRSNTLGTGTVPAAGLGKIKSYNTDRKQSHRPMNRECNWMFINQDDAFPTLN